MLRFTFERARAGGQSGIYLHGEAPKAPVQKGGAACTRGARALCVAGVDHHPGMGCGGQPDDLVQASSQLRRLEQLGAPAAAVARHGRPGTAGV